MRRFRLIVAFWMFAGFSVHSLIYAQSTLKVMTYNIHHANPPGKAGTIDVDTIAEVIKNQQPDLVAIQEVDVETNRSGKINEAKLLSEKTGLSEFYFGKTMDYDGGQYGLLVLSRFPINNQTTFPLPRADSAGGEPRVLTAVTVNLPDGKSFLFGSVHLEAYNKTSRILQAREITRIAKSSSIPLVVAGDFNATEGSEVINITDENFGRTCFNCPATFDENDATGAIDFITFYPKSAFKVVSHKVISEERSSDHFPVVAELTIKF